MEKINDGGPAFSLDFMPVNLPGVPTGMSLRDYFAAKAMAALIAHTGTDMADEMMRVGGYGNGEVDKLVAKCAFDYADAMLKAREVKS